MERYRRNIDIPGFGVMGQAKLLASSVLVVGAGGLGSAALPYLVGAGVGRIGIADGDDVELINLQRQVLHSELGVNKAESAAQRLAPLNPDVHFDIYPETLTLERATELARDYDLVLDCTDQFAAKLMLSDAAESAERPLIWAAAVSMQGQCSVFGVEDESGHRFYLRDLFPHEPSPSEYPRAVEVGVLGAAVAQLGALQACEAIKYLVGLGELLVGRVLILDALHANWSVVSFRAG